MPINILEQPIINSKQPRNILESNPTQSKAVDMLNDKLYAHSNQDGLLGKLSKFGGGIADIFGNIPKIATQGIITSAEARGSTANRVADIGAQQNLLIDQAKKYPIGSPERKKILETANKLNDISEFIASSAMKDLSTFETPKQALGTTGKALLNTALFGGGSATENIPGVVEKGFTLKGLGGTALHAIEGAAEGGAFQSLQNIEDKQNIGKNVPLAVAIGGILPVTLESASRIWNNIITAGPEKLVNSEIKPSLKQIKYGQNPGAAVAKEGIVGNSMEDIEDKINQKVIERGKEIGQLYRNNSENVANYTDSLEPLNDAIKKAEQHPATNASLIRRLKNARNDLLQITEKVSPEGEDIVESIPRSLENLTPEEAFNLKQEVSDLTQFAGTPTDDNAYNSVLHQVYGKIRDKLHELVPGLAQADEHFASLKSAQLAAQHRADIMMRQNMISFLPKIAGVASMIYGIASGDIKTTSLLLLGDLAAAAAGSTGAKTRIAYILSRLGRVESSPVVDAFGKMIQNFGIGLTGQGNQNPPIPTGQ